MFCIRHNKIGSNIIYVKCKKKKLHLNKTQILFKQNEFILKTYFNG